MMLGVAARHRLGTPASGFTLVEVLVALAIVAIALPALMVSLSEQIRGFSHLSDKSVAHWVAMNKMTQLRLQHQHKEAIPKDRQQGTSEMLERDWHWRVDTEKTANEQLLQVEVSVRLEPDDKAPALATLLHYFVLPLPEAPGGA